MSDPNPERQGHVGGHGHPGYVFGEAPQIEETYQIQSYYNGNGYGQLDGHDSSSRPNHDYAVEPAFSIGSNRYNSYSQHQYQNGYIPWGAQYDEYAHASRSVEPYAQEAFYETSYNYHQRPYSTRFQARGQRYTDAMPATTPPRSPSPTYISTSLSPSTSAETPSRKLLILDLNGTLLFRPKPVFQPRPQRPPPTGTSEDRTPSSHPFHPRAPAPFQPVKRTVHARPYLSCFKEYLFHPSTRKWLDVMIWSSAQPHSVKDMLQRCFPASEKGENGDKEAEGGGKSGSDGRFTAVWARDTLGLSSVDYSRKAQTTKDLHKPWSQLPPFRKREPLSDTTSLPEEESVLRHSAHTTLLLDDSPRKAHLQPWNHVCLKEYDLKMRDEDVKTLQRLRLEPDVKASHAEEADDTVKPSDITATPSDKTSISQTEASDFSFPSPLDPTLLAVIGVLEAIKCESNVAGWIRAGGLWANSDEAVKSDLVNDLSESNGTNSPPPAPITTPSPRSGIKRGRDTDDIDPRLTSPEAEPTKRPRLGSPGAPADPGAAHGEGLNRTSCPPLSCLPPSMPSSSLPPCLASDNGDGGTQGRESDEPKSCSAQQPLWFSHAPTFDFWSSKGKETLRGLSIKLEHGVTIDQEVEG